MDVSVAKPLSYHSLIVPLFPRMVSVLHRRAAHTSANALRSSYLKHVKLAPNCMVFSGEKYLVTDMLQQVLQDVIIPLGKVKSHSFLAFSLKRKEINIISLH